MHVATCIRSLIYNHHNYAVIMYKCISILTTFLFGSVVDQSCLECLLKVVVPDQAAKSENTHTAIALDQ